MYLQAATVSSSDEDDTPLARLPPKRAATASTRPAAPSSTPTAQHFVTSSNTCEDLAQLSAAAQHDATGITHSSAAAALQPEGTQHGRTGTITGSQVLSDAAACKNAPLEQLPQVNSQSLSTRDQAQPAGQHIVPESSELPIAISANPTPAPQLPHVHGQAAEAGLFPLEQELSHAEQAPGGMISDSESGSQGGSPHAMQTDNQSHSPTADGWADVTHQFASDMTATHESNGKASLYQPYQPAEHPSSLQAEGMGVVQSEGAAALGGPNAQASEAASSAAGAYQSSAAQQAVAFSAVLPPLTQTVPKPTQASQSSAAHGTNAELSSEAEVAGSAPVADITLASTARADAANLPPALPATAPSALASVASAIFAAQQGAAMPRLRASRSDPALMPPPVTATVPKPSEAAYTAALPVQLALSSQQQQHADSQRQMDSTASLLQAEAESARLRAALTSSRRSTSPALYGVTDASGSSAFTATPKEPSSASQLTMPFVRLKLKHQPHQGAVAAPASSAQADDAIVSHDVHNGDYAHQQTDNPNDVIIPDR